MVTEKYWTLLELTRQEFLADLQRQAVQDEARHPAPVGKPLPGLDVHDGISLTATPMSYAWTCMQQAFLSKSALS